MYVTCHKKFLRWDKSILKGTINLINFLAPGSGTMPMPNSPLHQKFFHHIMLDFLKMINLTNVGRTRSLYIPESQREEPGSKNEACDRPGKSGN